MVEAVANQREGNKLPKGLYQSSNGYSRWSTLAEYLVMAPLELRGKQAHISSQEKEAAFAMHDTLPQAVKASALYYKNIYTTITEQLIDLA